MVLMDSSDFEHTWPIPASLSVYEDANWTRLPSPTSEHQKEKCSFSIPLTSESIFVLSRGPFSSGTLNMLHGDSSDAVEVEVVARYRDRNVLEQDVKVCAVGDGDGAWGVGIFTKGVHYYDIYLTFDVFVRLPKPLGNSLVKINKLETAMPLFSHTVSDLASTVLFDSISLKTVNAPIIVRSLSAVRAKIETANSPIQGFFVASESVSVLTSNARILAKVLLRNDSSRGGVSELSMTTANGPIDSVISLISRNRHSNPPGNSLGIGGNFKITGSTALGGVNLEITGAPDKSCISVSAQTAMAPASVRMCESFEGEFGVSTSMGQAMVCALPRNEPRLRRNVVFRECSFTNVDGSIVKEQEGRSRGRIVVSTSMGSSKLIL